MNFSDAIRKEKAPSETKKLQMQTTDTEVTTPKIAETLRDGNVSTCKASPRVPKIPMHVFGETPIVDRKKIL